MESFTPRSLIAGRIKAVHGRELEIASAAAAAILSTERIALVHTRFQDEVWYLAAPAVDLASHSGCLTPLSAALPGAQGHEGDGAYTTDLANGLQAVVVKNGQELHSFVGTPAMAQRFASMEGAKITHACTGNGMPWQYPFELRSRRESRLHNAITFSGLLVAICASITWLWAAQSVSHLEEMRASLQQEQVDSWNTALRSREPQSYPKALANLQKAVEQAIKEKGALVQFEHKEGRANWTLNVNDHPLTGGAN